jgi:hypothetical protein
MMLESPVQRNLHAGFGGKHSEKGCHAVPRWVPTLLCRHVQVGCGGAPTISDARRFSSGSRSLGQFLQSRAAT